MDDECSLDLLLYEHVFLLLYEHVFLLLYEHVFDEGVVYVAGERQVGEYLGPGVVELFGFDAQVQGFEGQGLEQPGVEIEDSESYPEDDGVALQEEPVEDISGVLDVEDLEIECHEPVEEEQVGSQALLGEVAMETLVHPEQEGHEDRIVGGHLFDSDQVEVLQEGRVENQVADDPEGHGLFQVEVDQDGQIGHALGVPDHWVLHYEGIQ